MDALQKARQLTRRVPQMDDHSPNSTYEINERNELSRRDAGDEGLISSNSFLSYPENTETAAVMHLRAWLKGGRLHALPHRIPGFAGDLAQYADRACLTYMVEAILDAVPWSLTAEERAVQFVAVLSPLIERTEP